MFKRTKICSGVLLALGGTMALGVAPAFAQQANIHPVMRYRVKAGRRQHFENVDASIHGPGAKRIDMAYDEIVRMLIV